MHLKIVIAGLIFSAPFLVNYNVLGQQQRLNNSITGRVYGLNRQPLSDMIVELLDEFERTVARTRTNNSGYYEFTGIGAGDYSVRVFTFGTDYEEQTDRIEEIVNETVQAGNRVQTTGFESKMHDIFLKLHRGLTPENVALFVQDVPPAARKLYEKGISDLNDKHDAEGLQELKAAITAFPKYFEALNRLGMEYIRLGKPETYQAAEILLQAAVEVNARANKSWYALAYARYSLGKDPEALTAVEKSLELNAYAPEAHILRGALLRRAKKYPEAVTELRKAVEMSKDTMPKAHWELAHVYEAMARYADAAKELRLFLKAQPNSQDSEQIKKLIADFETKARAK
jgi:tetratricopeptide (TPR) repeat protein